MGKIKNLKKLNAIFSEEINNISYEEFVNIISKKCIINNMYKKVDKFLVDSNCLNLLSDENETIYVGNMISKSEKVLIRKYENSYFVLIKHYLADLDETYFRFKIL